MAVLYQSLGICILILSPQLLTRAEELTGPSFTLQDGDSFTTLACSDPLRMTMRTRQDEESPLSGNRSTHQNSDTEISFTMGDVWYKFSRLHLTLHGQKPQKVTFDDPDGNKRSYLAGRNSHSQRRFFPWGYGGFHSVDFVEELLVGFNWITLKQGSRSRHFSPQFTAPKPGGLLQLQVKIKAPNTTLYDFTMNCPTQQISTNSYPIWYVFFFITPMILLLLVICWHYYWLPEGGSVLCFNWSPRIHHFLFGEVPGECRPINLKENENEGNAEIDDFFYYQNIRNMSRVKSKLALW